MGVEVQASPLVPSAAALQAVLDPAYAPLGGALEQRMLAGSSLYYGSTGAFFSFVNPNNALLTAVPLFVGATRTFDRIAVQMSAAATAGGLMRLGIYGDTGGFPDALLLDAGTVATTGAAGTLAITINQQLARGLYWLAGAVQGNPATRGTFYGLQAGVPGVGLLAADWNSIGGTVAYVGNAAVAGALPANFGVGTPRNSAIDVRLRLP